MTRERISLILGGYTQFLSIHDGCNFEGAVVAVLFQLEAQPDSRGFRLAQYIKGT